MAAKKPVTPPPPFELLATSGPQSPNCTINPSFCTATQAQLAMCDGAMLLGDKDADLNGTTAHFRGTKVLAYMNASPAPRPYEYRLPVRRSEASCCAGHGPRRR